MRQILKLDIPTPAYILDEERLQNNLDILASVKQQTGCKILLALKAFSMYHVFPQMADVLDGVTSSSLNEVRLGAEEFKKETHIYAPAYADKDMKQIIAYADHIVFNSFSQLNKHRSSLPKNIEVGIRINPECSTVKTAIYNPCSPGSRLGVTIDQLKKFNLDGVDGLHFHALCEQNADALEQTLVAVEKKFGDYLHHLKWLNFGGGHHITRDDYNIGLLCQLINQFQSKYNLQVIIEPGEAVVLNAGYLVSSVLDIVDNEKQIAILDTSAAAHMPDVLEMPYRPNILGAGQPNEKQHTYQLAGNTCLAGDIIGDYSFDDQLSPGDKLLFFDMAQYSMVKNTTFNGINLPAILLLTKKKQIKTLKQFGYIDFKSRL